MSGSQGAADVLGTSGTAPAARIVRRRDRHARRRTPAPRSVGAARSDARRAGRDHVHGQHRVRTSPGRLPGIAAGAVATAALLVARPRGAVLHRLAATAAGRLQVSSTVSVASRSHDRRSPVGIVGALHPADAAPPTPGLLPAPDQSMGAARRRRPGRCRNSSEQGSRRRLRAAAGWLGLAAVVVVATRFSDLTRFPGVAAALPVLATVLVLAAGDCRFGPGIILDIRPLTWLGTRSYGTYLWHWPVLVFAAAAFGPLGCRATGRSPDHRRRSCSAVVPVDREPGATIGRG